MTSPPTSINAFKKHTSCKTTGTSLVTAHIPVTILTAVTKAKMIWGRRDSRELSCHWLGFLAQRNQQQSQLKCYIKSKLVLSHQS